MQPGFFDHVRDALEGFIDDSLGSARSSTHRRGVKVWFGPSSEPPNREHYEAQLIRHHEDAALEIGFHAEHGDPAANTATLERITNDSDWQVALGADAQPGPFLGRDGWTRISEVWPPPDPDDPEAPIETAARLADYINALEPIRASP